MSKNNKISKFSNLYENIPKSPELWDEKDVLKWLEMIGMDKYAESFSENKVDGLTILELNEDDIEQELQIKAKLHKKKVLKAIEMLKEYQECFWDIFSEDKKQKETKNECQDGDLPPGDQMTRGQDQGGNKMNRFRQNCAPTAQFNDNLVENSNEEEFQYNRSYRLNTQLEDIGNQDIQLGNFNNQNILREGSGANLSGPKFNPLASRPLEQSQHLINDEQPNQIVQTSNAVQAFLIINSIEGPSDVNHKIGEQGAKIGRHSSNQIVIYDESVSRYHAEISFCEESKTFYLTDIGSTSGTFLKIHESIEAEEGLILEIGSYQLQITKIYVSNASSIERVQDESFLEFTIYEAPEQSDQISYKLQSGSSIGRKSTNSLCFADDLHMSNLHCKINLIGKRFYFEDMASTNGSWIRLSKEGMISGPVPMTADTIFKIGNSAMYEVQLEEEVKKPIKLSVDLTDKNLQGQYCIICYEAERDCLIMPCKHNVSCTRCVKSQKKCPVCREDILDLIRMYKA